MKRRSVFGLDVNSDSLEKGCREYAARADDHGVVGDRFRVLLRGDAHEIGADFLDAKVTGRELVSG